MAHAPDVRVWDNVDISIVIFDNKDVLRRPDMIVCWDLVS